MGGEKNQKPVAVRAVKAKVTFKGGAEGGGGIQGSKRTRKVPLQRIASKRKKEGGQITTTLCFSGEVKGKARFIPIPARRRGKT